MKGTPSNRVVDKPLATELVAIIIAAPAPLVKNRSWLFAVSVPAATNKRWAVTLVLFNGIYSTTYVPAAAFNHVGVVATMKSAALVATVAVFTIKLLGEYDPDASACSSIAAFTLPEMVKFTVPAVVTSNVYAV
jgi:hypothetical protein